MCAQRCLQHGFAEFVDFILQDVYQHVHYIHINVRTQHPTVLRGTNAQHTVCAIAATQVLDG